jgi:hypothetical protein
VVDVELRAPVEELGQGLRAGDGVKLVLLLDRHPRQLEPLFGELVAAAGQLLLALEQLLACGEPLVAGPDGMVRHRFTS